MSGAEEVRVGIVGAGYIAQVHSAGYRAVSGTYEEGPQRVTQAAVADAAPERAERLASGWGWERTEPDWRAITRADDVDVVDISVPNALHAEIAIDALEQGKHVICEKPLANDVAGAEAMQAAAAASGRVAQVCFYYRLWPAIAWARELVAAGTIGELQHFRGWMLQDYAAEAAHDMGWRARHADAGAGALGDIGSHIIDIGRSLCGDLARVAASARSTVDRVGAGETAIDDLVAMLVEFEGGASGVIEASWALRGHKCDLGFDLVGSDGAIRFCWERANEIEVLEGGADPAGGFRRVLIGGAQPEVANFVAVPGQGLGYRDAFTIGLGRALAAIAGGGGDPGPSFADGLAVNRTVAAVLASAREGGWVDVGGGLDRQ
ncbi:MAG: Gfo/Idh/MocA family protein [Solirubrobacterales bacterium]